MEFPAGFGQILQKAQEMQQKVAEMQRDVEKLEVEASAGGGMVRVKANGAQKIVSITIDSEVVNKDEVEMLQDLIQAATNEAIRKSKDLLQDEMKKLTGGIPIPGF